MPSLKVFTKEPTGENNPYALAGSVHFAFKEEGKAYKELNNGYGMLFARASIRQNNTLEPKTLGNPRIYCAEGEYLIFAEEQSEEGKPLPAEECLATIWHNRGVALTGLMMYGKAAAYFFFFTR